MGRLIQIEENKMTIEQLIIDHGGKLASGSGVSGLFIIGYMKIKQQCREIIELKKDKVDKDIYEAEKKTQVVQFDGLEKEITEMKKDNKDSHDKLFKKLDDVLLAVSQ